VPHLQANQLPDVGWLLSSFSMDQVQQVIIINDFLGVRQGLQRTPQFQQLIPLYTSCILAA
jgi:hypothetical protein